MIRELTALSSWRQKRSALSVTRQQAESLLKRLNNKLKLNKEYPFILRRDVYRAETKVTPYWLKIPLELGAELTFL